MRILILAGVLVWLIASAMAQTVNLSALSFGELVQMEALCNQNYTPPPPISLNNCIPWPDGSIKPKPVNGTPPCDSPYTRTWQLGFESCAGVKQARQNAQAAQQPLTAAPSPTDQNTWLKKMFGAP